MQLLFIAVSGKVFALIIGFFYFKRFSALYKLLYAQVLLAFACETFGFFMGPYRQENNVWIFNIYIIAEAWLMGIFAATQIENKIVKRALLILLSLACVLWFWDIAFQGWDVMANKFVISYSIILILAFIYILFNKAFGTSSIARNHIFWISLSAILYFACIIPYKGLENYLIKESPSLAYNLFYILLAVNFIRYPLVAVAFYFYGKEKELAHKAASHVI